jgi:hypothetical protein
MTLQGWREAVQGASRDTTLAELMAQLLFEQDAAKNRLRELGYGCIGMPWAKVVEEVADRDLRPKRPEPEST